MSTPNLYKQMRSMVEAVRCETCRGLGTCDDAGPGDIMFNTWTCKSCGGTGVDPTATLSITYPPAQG